MTPRTPVPAVRVAVMAVIVAAFAGCAGGGGDGDAGSGGASVRARVEPIYRELAQCIRDHGYPGFPDPVVKDDGTVELPDDVQRTLEQHQDTLRRHCDHIVRRLPAEVRDKDQAEEPATPAQLAERRRFAQCVRQHGVPDFPDPDANGFIRIPRQPDGRASFDRTAVRAFEACGGKQGAELKQGLDELGVR